MGPIPYHGVIWGQGLGFHTIPDGMEEPMRLYSNLTIRNTLRICSQQLLMTFTNFGKLLNVIR